MQNEYAMFSSMTSRHTTRLADMVSLQLVLSLYPHYVCAEVDVRHEER